MEWMIPVNQMLSEEITKLNYTLIPPGFQGDVRSVRTMQESLAKLIDQLGEQSAAAQSLSKVITTAEKLRNSPTHILYLLKDAKAKGGEGEVIGMLKVGRKHLFLFDGSERVREVEPLCVLDFYVVGDRQRLGHGRALFDHMLRDLDTAPHLLAIDGPSPKMEHFLSKNYQMGPLLRQNNNFAVSPRFFDNTTDDIRLNAVTVARQMLAEEARRAQLARAPDSKSGCTTPVSPAVGRYAARKPQSAIATVIHGGAAGGGDAYQRRANGVSVRGESELEPPASPEWRRGEVDEEEAAPLEVELEVHASPERPTSLPVAAPATPPAASHAASHAAHAAPAAPSPAGSTMSRRDSQLTDKGFFDVKFYHNKLW